MDLSSPIRSVIPSAHGAVLGVLARTTEPLSGRGVAALANGRVSQHRANKVLGELARDGIVLRAHHPPAILYTLNRDHVASAGVAALAAQWDTLMERVREELRSWKIPVLSACLFGSAARGDADAGSDIDVLLVADVPPGEDENDWHAQVSQLAARVQLWSGNACEVLELTPAELSERVKHEDRLVEDLRRDAIPLVGRDIRGLTRRQMRR